MSDTVRPSAAELGQLLRARRDALQPAQVGLPSGGRRRTRGLRREEVALLASISTTYLAFLEQGRDVRPSLSVDAALADAVGASTFAAGDNVVPLNRDNG